MKYNLLLKDIDHYKKKFDDYEIILEKKIEKNFNIQFSDVKKNNFKYLKDNKKELKIDYLWESPKIK